MDYASGKVCIDKYRKYRKRKKARAWYRGIPDSCLSVCRVGPCPLEGELGAGNFFMTIYLRAGKPGFHNSHLWLESRGRRMRSCRGRQGRYSVSGQQRSRFSVFRLPSSVFRKTANGDDGHGDSGPSGLRPVGCGASALVDAGIFVSFHTSRKRLGGRQT